MVNPVLRLAVGVCALSMTAAIHAAAPISLPLGDLGLQSGAAVELPLPPPPPAARPDVSRMRLIIKQQPAGCSVEDDRRTLTVQRQVAAQPDPWLTKPAWSRLG